MKANKKIVFYFFSIFITLIILYIFIIQVFFNGNSHKFISKLKRNLTDDNYNLVEEIKSRYPCIPSPDNYQYALVTKVIDGDSIQVLIEGNEYEIRYIGIDAPEYYSDDQAKALAAKLANQALVGGKELLLFRDKSETDKYFRLLRYVFVDTTFVNYKMVSEGYAVSKPYHPDVACQRIFDEAMGYP